jgi:hypothetical protein
MAETNTPEVAVEAAAPETVPAPETPSGRGSTITTTVWAEGKTASREALFNQAIANTRDAIPVASYDVSCEVKGAKAKQVDKVEGHAWEVAVTYTPSPGSSKEPVDVERVISEAKIAAGGVHPGDPDFLGDQPA